MISGITIAYIVLIYHHITNDDSDFTNDDSDITHHSLIVAGKNAAAAVADAAYYTGMSEVDGVNDDDIVSSIVQQHRD